MRYVDHMTNPTTVQAIEASASAPTHTSHMGVAIVTHLDADLDLALDLLLDGGLSGALICDGSCHGTASCCTAPVAAETASLAA